MTALGARRPPRRGPVSDRYALEVAERAIAEQADRTEAAGDRPGAACLRMVADHVRWLAVRS